MSNNRPNPPLTGVSSAFTSDTKKPNSSGEMTPGKKIFRFLVTIGVGIAILWLLMLIWRFFFPSPVWEQTITIGPNYPTTHHSITSGGRCNTNPILLLARYEDIEKDNNCLIWEFANDSSKTVWREAGLKIRLQNGSIMTKPVGVKKGGVIDAVVDIRSTDGKIHEVTLKMRCPCRE